MADSDLIEDATTPTNGKVLPESVLVGGAPRLTPNELRMLRVITGKTLQSVMEDEADAMQAMVWLKLRRLGYQPTWDEAGDVEADLSGQEPPDPSLAAYSTKLPGSAAFGDAPPETSTP